MIELKDVKKVFNAGRPNEVSALAEVNLRLDQQAAVFKGPSGSGKTTLLSLIGCMARPTAGRIFVLDQEVTSLPERFLTLIRRQTFGFIFQQYNLLRGVSVLENVMLPAFPNGESYGALKKRAGNLLSMFNLSDKAGAKVEWLSGGEAQRAAIARALINDPAVIIADEPTAHLDTKLSQEFMAIMQDFKASGKTILLASHDPLVHESAVVDQVIDMRDGKIIGVRSA